MSPSVFRTHPGKGSASAHAGRGSGEGLSLAAEGCIKHETCDPHMLPRCSLPVGAQPHGSSQALLCCKQWKHFALQSRTAERAARLPAAPKAGPNATGKKEGRQLKHLAFWTARIGCCRHRASGGCLVTASARIFGPDVIYLEISILAAVQGTRINISVNISPLMSKNMLRMLINGHNINNVQITLNF